MQSSQALLEALMKMSANKIAPTLGANPYMPGADSASASQVAQQGKGGSISAPGMSSGGMSVPAMKMPVAGGGKGGAGGGKGGA